MSLLEILKRRRKYHLEDFGRLHLVAPVDLPALKATWPGALADAVPHYGRPGAGASQVPFRVQ